MFHKVAIGVFVFFLSLSSVSHSEEVNPFFDMIRSAFVPSYEADLTPESGVISTQESLVAPIKDSQELFIHPTGNIPIEGTLYFSLTNFISPGFVYVPISDLCISGGLNPPFPSASFYIHPKYRFYSKEILEMSTGFMVFNGADWRNDYSLYVAATETKKDDQRTLAFMIDSNNRGFFDEMPLRGNGPRIKTIFGWEKNIYNGVNIVSENFLSSLVSASVSIGLRFYSTSYVVSAAMYYRNAGFAPFLNLSYKL